MPVLLSSLIDVISNYTSDAIRVSIFKPSTNLFGTFSSKTMYIKRCV